MWLEAWNGSSVIGAYLFAPAMIVDRLDDQADEITEALNKALSPTEMYARELVASPLSSAEGWRDRISAGLNGPTNQAILAPCDNGLYEDRMRGEEGHGGRPDRGVEAEG